MADSGVIKIKVVPDFSGFAQELRDMANSVDTRTRRVSIDKNTDTIGVWVADHYSAGAGWVTVATDGRHNFYFPENLPDGDWHDL